MFYSIDIWILESKCQRVELVQKIVHFELLDNLDQREGGSKLQRSFLAKVEQIEECAKALARPLVISAASRPANFVEFSENALPVLADDASLLLVERFNSVIPEEDAHKAHEFLLAEAKPVHWLANQLLKVPKDGLKNAGNVRRIGSALFDGEEAVQSTGVQVAVGRPVQPRVRLPWEHLGGGVGALGDHEGGKEVAQHGPLGVGAELGTQRRKVVVQHSRDEGKVRLDGFIAHPIVAFHQSLGLLLLLLEWTLRRLKMMRVSAKLPEASIAPQHFGQQGRLLLFGFSFGLLLLLRSAGGGDGSVGGWRRCNG